MNNEESSCSLESLSNPGEVLQTTFEFCIKEKLKEDFKLRYRVRRVMNKGAILVIVWNFFVGVMYYYHLHIIEHIQQLNFHSTIHDRFDTTHWWVAS